MMNCTRQVALSRAILLPAYILLGGAVYLAMLRLLRAIKTEDVNFAGRFLGRRLAFLSNLLAAILLLHEPSLTANSFEPGFVWLTSLYHEAHCQISKGKRARVHSFCAAGRGVCKHP
jgi:hypothetical protein